MTIHVGVAGFAYDDWSGKVYPVRKPRGFDALSYLGRYVDAIEINTSFYRPVGEAMAASWLRRVRGLATLSFTAKLHKSFTHERPDGKAYQENVRATHEGMGLLTRAGRLGALLMQFPYSFRESPEAIAWIERLAETFSAYPLVIEVRHASWIEPGALGMLAARGIGFCNVDQPRLGASVSGTALTSGRVGYVRLHGRNAKDWFRKGAGRDARYDYLYSPEELAPWKAKIEKIAAASPVTYVIANNHFEGKAVVNALELKAALTGTPVDVPPDLVTSYPRLRTIARSLSPSQGSLFE